MTPIADVLDLLVKQHDETTAQIERIRYSDVTERPALIDVLGEQITLHLAIEQELLYPAARHVAGALVFEELIAEHCEIKRILADVLWLEPSGPVFEGLLATLDELLAAHSAWQESELFAEVTASYPDEVLDSIASDLRSWMDGGAHQLAA